MYAAVGPIPAIFVGSILGGYLIKRFNLDAVGASKLAVAASTLGIIIGIGMMLLGCPNLNIDGVYSSQHNVSLSSNLYSLNYRLVQ